MGCNPDDEHNREVWLFDDGDYVMAIHSETNLQAVGDTDADALRRLSKEIRNHTENKPWY